MTDGKYRDTLRQPGFLPFFWTQFLGAFNDNFLKMVVSLVAYHATVNTPHNYYVELIAVLFILPSALFSGYAGHLADVFSKRSVLISVKVFEVVIMLLAFAAFLAGHLESMLAIVFLMGLHAAFFSPAKYGILPEMLPERELSRGNGLLEMSTFVAIILGTSLSGPIYESSGGSLLPTGGLLMAIAIVGLVTSLGIARVPPSGAAKLLRLNPFGEICDGFRRLRHDRPLWLTVVGISYFWFLGALVQIDMLFFGKELLALTDAHVTLLGTFLAIGIGIGSLAAGRLSGDHIEVGLVPVGSAAMGICLGVLAFSAPSYPATATALVMLGFSGGLFAVPLNALLQHRSGREEKGQLIATNNFLNTVGMFLAAGTHWVLKTPLGLPPDGIIFLIGVITLAGTSVILYLIPDYFVRSILWLITHSIYRIKIVGAGHIPARGPALLVSNHVSFVDAFMIGASMPHLVRFILHRDYYDLKALNWFFRMMHVIPVSATNRRDIIQSIKRARNELDKGHIVCIFAEGSICRTGHLLPFKRGFEKIVEGTNVPVIPVHLDQLWGSIFSFKGGRFFWKRPERVFHPVTVSFGAPLPSSATAIQVRNAVLELESNAFSHRACARDLLHTRFIQSAKRSWFSFCMADTTGVELTYGKVLIGAFMLARWIKRHCRHDTMVGVLLPASVGGALVNLAALLAGKVPVNLNFTAGPELTASAVSQCHIKTIVTSRAFLSRAKLDPFDGMVFLEDVRRTFGALEKTLATLKAVLPARWLNRGYFKRQRPSDLATVIFSSGSTGAPKGVMLSHWNIVSNIEGICQVIQFERRDRIMGVLPLFHSFGFTGTLWLPLLARFGVVYHFNPTDAKTIGETVQKYKATLLISTPTFYAGYLRRCAKEEFASLRYLIAGAEKLREQIVRGYEEKFGLTILEGYGCTELSPVVSVNVPDVFYKNEKQVGNKPGTVGHPIPGVVVKVVDPDTEEPLTCGREGLLLVSGPNVMLGYLGQPQLTDQALRRGWYVTGDMAELDEDGFIRITDRLSRFSKIGGEMVPHMKVEEAINQIIGAVASAVTGVPDEHRGEKLVAFYAQNSVSRDELWHKLNQSDLPKLWIPKRENLHQIDSIPVLGSGKVDLKKIKALALEQTQPRP